MDMRIKVSLMCVLSIFIVSCATTQGTSVGKSDDSGMVVLKGDDTFKNAAAGFSIKKPEGWVYLSADDMEESRNSVKFNDEEFAEYVKARANMPLVVIAKYTEPYEDLNPSIQVVIRPVGGSSEQDVEVVKLLGYVNNVLKGTFDNFKVIEKPEGVKVSGIKSAYSKTTYTVKTQYGASFDVMSRMYIVPKGRFYYLVSMSGPQSGDDISEEEFKEALKTIRIHKR